MFLTTRGLVLREVRYKESDKILTVLTQHEGKVTVRARGALRKGSRITAATQLLTYSDMTIFENRGRRTLNEASTVEEFLGLRADLGAFALGSYFAELLETVSAEEYPDPPVLQLGLNSLYALSRALCPPEQIKAVFELRLMCLAGYEPDLSCCARCGAPEPAEPWLSLRGGGIGHRVRAVREDEAVIRIIVRTHARRHLQPVAAVDVRAVAIHELHGVDAAQLLELRHLGQQLLGGELRRESVGRRLGRDRAAGGDHKNMLHISLSLSSNSRAMQSPVRAASPYTPRTRAQAACAPRRRV